MEPKWIIWFWHNLFLIVHSGLCMVYLRWLFSQTCFCFTSFYAKMLDKNQFVSIVSFADYFLKLDFVMHHFVPKCWTNISLFSCADYLPNSVIAIAFYEKVEQLLSVLFLIFPFLHYQKDLFLLKYRLY